MGLHVHNTATGRTEPFEPADPDTVTLYYCGLTVSDPPHLGHARSWVHVDVMVRWLEHLGYTVRHVENFTDVNEKIVARTGGDRGESEAAVARSYIAEAIAAMRGLNLSRATVYPRVSEHVPEIIDLVESLIERGHAYESNGSVYFDVTGYEGYGKLSNQDLEEIESQGDPEERGDKRHPADFALWKAGGVDPDAVAEHRHQETLLETTGQTWDSPWGPGRPGWHIECSAMSMAHLETPLDIHVGGRDLVFPHHENEIAQSEAATGEQFASHWLHCSLFEVEDEKMSSSLQNFITVAEALERWGTNGLRTFLTAASYNSSQRYTEAAIEEALERWNSLERAHDRGVRALDSPDALTTIVDDDLREATTTAERSFTDAMNDDFNTREAQAALLELAGAINRHTENSAYDYQGLRTAIETIEELGGVLGLTFGVDTREDGRLEALVEHILSLREEARRSGQYDRADEYRSALEDAGITVEDTDDGPTYHL